MSFKKWLQDLLGQHPEIELTPEEIQQLKDARRESYVKERITVERERGKELARPEKKDSRDYFR
jgi:hypothetical protein